MSSNKKKTPAEELLDSLLSEVGEDASTNIEGIINLDSDEATASLVLHPAPEAPEAGTIQGLVNLDMATVVEKRNQGSDAKTEIWNPNAMTEIRGAQHSEERTHIRQDTFASEEASGYESTRIGPSLTADTEDTFFGDLDLSPIVSGHDDEVQFEEIIPVAPTPAPVFENVRVTDTPKAATSQPATPQPATPQPAAPQPATPPSLFSSPPDMSNDLKTEIIPNIAPVLHADKTQAIASMESPLTKNGGTIATAFRNESAERTLAVAGFHIKHDENIEDKIKVSVGHQSRSAGFASWGGGIEGNLGQAENLRMAQEKILALENENEKTRRQNEELIAATEIMKERSDLLTAQLTEYKGDRDNLEQSFKNELTLLKNHLVRKDAELRKAQFKVDELDSRLKFDLKKIRVRERELENRLELVRAEKNAISKNKDEQILDLRRKMDVMQMEVDSYRQKCVDLNKQIENSQDSFKRTTRALRLAMANLELQEENKVPLKKAE